MRGVFVVCALLAFLALAPPALVAGEAPLDLALALDLVADEYEAGVDNGRVVNEMEYAEAGIFLRQARELAAGEPDLAALLPALDAVAMKIAAIAPSQEVRADLATIRSSVEEIAGKPLVAVLPPGVDLALGGRVFAASCLACHGEGAGEIDGFAPPVFTAAFLVDKSPAQLFTAVGMGIAGTPMEPWSEWLSQEERWSVVLWLWSNALDPLAGEGREWLASSEPSIMPLVREAVPDAALLALTDLQIRGALSGRVPAARVPGVAAALRTSWEHPLSAPGTDQIVGRIMARLEALGEDLTGSEFSRRGLTVYLESFEPYEPSLRLVDHAWAMDVERAFHALLQSPEPGRRDAMDSLLALLADAPDGIGPQGRMGRFLASATIIFREGLEAFLLIFVLLGFLRASSRPGLAKWIWWGVASALAVTALVAGLAGHLLSAADTEIVEGLTMLLAAMVLLAVSLWLSGQATHLRWKTGTKVKVDYAVRKNSPSVIWGIAFLVVFREGLETVLFYQPLLRGTPGESTAVAAGFLAGVALLAVAGVAMVRMSAKIPFGILFAATGLFLFGMAFVFAGQGIQELQEGGWLMITPLPWAPTFSPLGMAPVLESVAAQILVLSVGAMALLARRRAARTA